LSVAIGACAGVVLYLLWPLLSVPPDIGVYIRSIGLTPSSWPVFIAYYVLVNPFLEEYFWRGCLGSKAKHPILNDFLFAGYHMIVLAGSIAVPWLAVVFLVLCVAAWYWRQISIITGGLLAAILSHLAADITVILAIFYLTSAL
jgi:membrane protease YdiL (CAAX protease family)